MTVATSQQTATATDAGGSQAQGKSGTAASAMPVGVLSPGLAHADSGIDSHLDEFEGDNGDGLHAGISPRFQVHAQPGGSHGGPDSASGASLRPVPAGIIKRSNHIPFQQRNNNSNNSVNVSAMLTGDADAADAADSSSHPVLDGQYGNLRDAATAYAAPDNRCSNGDDIGNDAAAAVSNGHGIAGAATPTLSTRLSVHHHEPLASPAAIVSGIDGGLSLSGATSLASGPASPASPAMPPRLNRKSARSLNFKSSVASMTTSATFHTAISSTGTISQANHPRPSSAYSRREYDDDGYEDDDVYDDDDDHGDLFLHNSGPNISSESWPFSRPGFPHVISEVLDQAAADSREGSSMYPRYSFMISTDTADGPVMELVNIYRARVLSDYVPTTLISGDGDGENEFMPIPLREGEMVNVFGSKSVGYTDTTTGEFWRSDQATNGTDIKTDVNVAGGWCHVERADNTNGFAPISYLHFEPIADGLEEDLPVHANLRNSSHGFIIDPKPHHRVSATQFITSFPAPPPDSGVSSHCDDLPSTGITSMFLDPARVGTTIHSAWSSLFHSTDGIREFILRGPVPTPETSRQRGHLVEASILDRQGSLPLTTPSVYTIESRGNNIMHWMPQLSAFKVLVHAPLRRKATPTGRRGMGLYTATDEFVSYKITTWFASSSELAHETEGNVTVERRFNDFTFLHAHLKARFPAHTLATLSLNIPPKNALGSRFDPVLIEERQRGLQMYIDRLVAHPLVRSEDIVMSFLSVGGVANDPSILDDVTPLAFDEESCVPWVDDGQWRDKFGAPAASERAVSSFYEHVIVPDSAKYNGLSMSTFKLRCVGAVTERLENRLAPLIDATTKYQMHGHEMKDSFLLMAQALQSMGRQMARTGGEHPGCWLPTCQDCRPIGDALITASLQLKHVSEIYGSHSTKSVAHFVQHTRNFKAMLAPVKTLTTTYHAATQTATQALQDDADRGHPSSLAGMSSPHHDIQKRAAVVLAVAEAEAVHAHDERLEMIESGMADWLDDEIDKYERILRRLRAARAGFTGPNSRM
ncbi:hypothetical protein BC831DRAFT_440400 [Entophlyctis helioformis]|nr:hypothetical protein BC831DRAFT_440400 [Entophlyctis helioformis]